MPPSWENPKPLPLKKTDHAGEIEETAGSDNAPLDGEASDAQHKDGQNPPHERDRRAWDPGNYGKLDRERGPGRSSYRDDD